MSYAEDDLLPISALQHLIFCPRQCALIHIEGAWLENRLTAEGRILHDKTHERESESRGDIHIARGLRIHSLRLGLVGMADVVEFHRVRADGVVLHGVDGLWKPFPVEYKRGKPKSDDSDKIQLCAQAICLEEMLNTSIPSGSLFYGTTRRRQDVAFTPQIRIATEDAALRLHALFDLGITPAAKREVKCENCSLLNLCMPDLVGDGKSALRYLEHMTKI